MQPSDRAERPERPVDASQAYFWTREWQEEEREADEDETAGRVKKFASAEDAVKYLERLNPR